jgi:hypothetical protein
MSEVTDKHGQPINEGDHVSIPIRGGHREGDARFARAGRDNNAESRAGPRDRDRQG